MITEIKEMEIFFFQNKLNVNLEIITVTILSDKCNCKESKYRISYNADFVNAYISA